VSRKRYHRNSPPPTELHLAKVQLYNNKSQMHFLSVLQSAENNVFLDSVSRTKSTEKAVRFTFPYPSCDRMWLHSGWFGYAA
jgi:hypothetical protein